MQDDPVRYWQDLTDNYRQMSDGELLELAEKPEDLTDVAQQVLRDEMKKRKLDTQQPPIAAPGTRSFPRKNYDVLAGPLADSYGVPTDSEDVDEEADEDEDETPAEYTWKTLLCDCASNDSAQQLHATLARHGIESWVRYVPAFSTDVIGPQVYVAADQLEQAQAVTAQPIPQDIVDESKQVIPEFELPTCPRCGSKDGPVLQSADPVNAWMCEACGAEWTDSETADDDDATGEKSPAR